MMKHLLYRVIVFSVAFLCSLILAYDNHSYAGPIVGITTTQTTNTLNQDPNKVIDTSSIKGNPITEGTNTAIGNTAGSKGKIDGITTISTNNYATTLSAIMQKIQNIVNRSLGLVAVLCVIYLVYQGVLLLTKFDDDKAQSEALGSIKKIAWVIGGIGLTWFIVTTIFYIIGKFA